jgi:hypothetical protein
MVDAEGNALDRDTVLGHSDHDHDHDHDDHDEAHDDHSHEDKAGN